MPLSAESAFLTMSAKAGDVGWRPAINASGVLEPKQLVPFSLQRVPIRGVDAQDVGTGPDVDVLHTVDRA